MSRTPRHHVFLPADLVARIDAVRDGRTRTEEIRRRLEESLRPTAADRLRAALVHPEKYEPPTFVRTDGTWTVGPGEWSTQSDGLTWTAQVFDEETARAVVEWQIRPAARVPRTCRLLLTWAALESAGLAEWARTAVAEVTPVGDPPRGTVTIDGELVLCRVVRAERDGTEVSVWFEEVTDD